MVDAMVDDKGVIRSALPRPERTKLIAGGGFVQGPDANIASLWRPNT